MIQPKLFAILSNWGQGSPGGSIVPSTPVSCCGCDSNLADSGRMFRLLFLGRGRASSNSRSSRQLRRRGRARGLAFAARAVEGRAFARHIRRGEVARGRAFAGRARRKRRGQVARAARWSALFLVRRGRHAGRRHVARQACGERVRHDHARNRRARHRAAAAARDRGEPLAVAQYMEPRDRKPLFGLDREAL